MCHRIVPALAMVCGLAGCDSLLHGPATRVVSSTTRTDHLQLDETGGVHRVLVTESRLSDERGREWTERAVIGIEPEPGGLPQVEAELFQEAQHKARSASADRPGAQ